MDRTRFADAVRFFIANHTAPDMDAKERPLIWLVALAAFFIKAAPEHEALILSALGALGESLGYDGDQRTAPIIAQLLSGPILASDSAIEILMQFFGLEIEPKPRPLRVDLLTELLKRAETVNTGFELQDSAETLALFPAYQAITTIAMLIDRNGVQNIDGLAQSEADHLRQCFIGQGNDEADTSDVHLAKRVEA